MLSPLLKYGLAAASGFAGTAAARGIIRSPMVRSAVLNGRSAASGKVVSLRNSAAARYEVAKPRIDRTAAYVKEQAKDPANYVNAIALGMAVHGTMNAAVSAMHLKQIIMGGRGRPPTAAMNRTALAAGKMFLGAATFAGLSRGAKSMLAGNLKRAQTGLPINEFGHLVTPSPAAAAAGVVKPSGMPDGKWAWSWDNPAGRRYPKGGGGGQPAAPSPVPAPIATQSQVPPVATSVAPAAPKPTKTRAAPKGKKPEAPAAAKPSTTKEPQARTKRKSKKSDAVPPKL